MCKKKDTIFTKWCRESSKPPVLRIGAGTGKKNKTKKTKKKKHLMLNVFAANLQNV